MLKCPTCNRDLPMLSLQNESDICPFCGNPLVPPHLMDHKKEVDVLNTEEMKPFHFVDPQLYDRIRNIEPKGSWHLAVIAEIFDYEHRRLSDSLNETNTIRNCMLNLKGHKARIGLIKQQFDEFVHCIADIQEIFIRNLAPEANFIGMVGLWDFYQELSNALNRLAQFHRTAVSLRFVRDSLEHEIQGQMIDWVHYVLICFEGLKKQLDRKCKLEPAQLRDRSVQVTLCPPNLHLFFSKLDRLSEARS